MRTTLMLGMLIAGVTLSGSPFPASMTEAVVDFAACRVLHEDGAEPAEMAAIRELLGLGQGNAPAPTKRASSSRKPTASLQFLLVFKQPVALGTVLGGVGELRVLKPNATLPPEPASAADWTSIEVQPNQSAPRFAPLPSGTQTRALLVSVSVPRDSRQSPFLRLLAPRLANHTPAAVANAESDYTTKPTASPPYTYDAGHLTRGHGEWINSGKDEKGINSRAPITELEPAWFILSWPTARRINGVLLQENFTAFELQAFTGPTGINATAATEQEWKTIRQFKTTRDGARRWLTFDPVQTRALRLVITKTDDGAVAKLAGFSAFTDLAAEPAPAIVKPASAEPPLQITYEIAQAGKVTLVVDRADGTRVRNLVANTPRHAGKNTVAWDLKDEAGNYVPPGDYKWKAITHPPLELRYEMTAYPNISSHFPERPAWLTGASGSGGWLADHTPPRSACVAGDRVFLGAPVAESGVSLIECDLDGRKHWGHPSFEAFTGSWLLASDGKTVFSLAPAHNFAKAGMDKNTEAIWAVDIATKKVRTLAMLQPSAERKRGAQGLAAHDGKVFVAVHGAENWFQNAAGAADVDLQNSLPTYPVARKPRAAYEIVPDHRTDFLRLFRLKDQPPGFGQNHGLVQLETTQNPTRQQHIVLAFTKPVSIGSLVFPPPAREDKMQFSLAVLKPAAPYPPRPDERGDWVNVPLTDTNVWAVVPLPAGTTTRALRMTFTRGGGGANDDLLADVEDKKGAPTLDLADKPAAKKGGFAGADDGLWQRRLEGMKLLGRRFENLFSTATVRVNSGKVARDGSWDAQRTEPLSTTEPGIYALEWQSPQPLRGLALREVDGELTEVDVFTGPAGAPVDITSDAGWEKVASYRQPLRDYYNGHATSNPYARYLDGYVDFGREVSTRAVRLRIVKQWDTKAHYPSGIRFDLGGDKLDTKRCRVFGVAALRYLGGEPAVDSQVTERIEMLDGETGKVLKEVHVPRIAEAGKEWSRGNLLAVNARGDVFTVSDEKLVQVDFNGGPLRVLVSDLKKPSALACDRAGNFYVFDASKERKNIRVYDPSGKFLREIGEPGGYQRGLWNQQRMDHVTALAVDSRNQIWAVDWNYWPKRISLWSADGKFQKEFLGPTEYGGAGQLDPGDKRRLFYGPLEFELDWASGKSRLKNLLNLDGHGASDSPIYVGKRLYLVNTRPGGHGPSQSCGVVYLHEGDRSRLVAAVGLAGKFAPLLDPQLVKSFGGKVLMDYLCAWSDLNGDEKVQPEEVQLWPKPKNVRVVFDSQLGVQMGSIGFRVKEVRPDGVPVYERADLPGLWEGVALRLNDGNFYHFEDEYAQRNAAGVQGPDGKVLWTYQTEGAGVHSLTRAKPWHPAQMVCHFGFAGHATAHSGDLGEFLVFNSNVGIFDIMTADGLFAGQIFRDIRDPKALPWSGTNVTRGLRLDDITPGQEHFQGYFTRTADNKYYAVAGHNHASVVEVVGLDRFKRFGGGLKVGGADLTAAQIWERSREARVLYARAPVLDAYRMSAPKLDGKLNDWGPVSAELDRDAKFRIGYDDQNLYLAYEINRRGPLKNQGQQWDRLFKTGASVDLQIAADPAADPDRKAPAPGDQRLLLTLIGSQPAAVLYQAVVPGTPPDKAWQVVSPVHSVAFDRVTRLDSPRLVVEDTDNGYILEASIPLSALGLKITPGLRLKLDWGVLVSGPDGTEVLRREYWANKVTQITADAPSEAELHPELWGHVRFHTERTAALDPTAKKKEKSVEDLLNDLK